MSREYLATRLMSGKDESPSRTRWWPRHSKITSRYLLSATGGMEASLPGIRELVASTSKEWECMEHRSKKGLMAEHSMLETELIDAALRNDIPTIDQIGQRLTENAVVQTDVFKAAIKDFPSERFKDLLVRHIGLFIDSVEARMTGDEKSFVASEERRRENTIALAGFSTEWL
jgi:hypothetical protein